MKIRTDYVTNSSSSSFILARKEELSEAQKEAVLGYVARKMLGNTILTPSSSEEEIQETFDDFYISEENQAAIRQALADSKTVSISNAARKHRLNCSNGCGKLWKTQTRIRSQSWMVTWTSEPKGDSHHAVEN